MGSALLSAWLARAQGNASTVPARTCVAFAGLGCLCMREQWLYSNRWGPPEPCSSVIGGVSLLRVLFGCEPGAEQRPTCSILVLGS